MLFKSVLYDSPCSQSTPNSIFKFTEKQPPKPRVVCAVSIPTKVLHGESVILKNTERDQSVSALVALCGHFFYLPSLPFFSPFLFI